MEKWQYVQSIYNKVIAKCPAGTLQKYLNKNPLSYPLSTNYGVSWDERKGTNLMLCSPNYNTATACKTGEHIRFLNFATEQERHNAWESYLSKFARFCIAMDESTKLAPYMGDYTQPWTDERFKEYFELSDEEWKVIDESIT